MNKTLLAALSLSTAAGANAIDFEFKEGLFYAGANLGTMNVEIFDERQGLDRSLNVSALEGVAGYKFHKYLSAEVRLGVGLNDETEIHQGPANVVADDPTTMENEARPVVLDDVPDEGFRTTIADGRAFQTLIETNFYASIYLKPELENDVAKLYGLIGFTFMDISQEFSEANFTSRTVTNGEGIIVDGSFGTDGFGGFFSDDINDSGLSLGVGISFFVNETTTVNFEYKNHIQGTDRDSFRTNGVSVGFDIRF